MRVNHDTRFPYPVLSPDTTDYPEGAFDVDLQVTEERDSGEVTIKYSAKLEEATIANEVDQDRAEVVLFITCQRTYYNAKHVLNLGSGELKLEPGLLREAVLLRPYIAVTKPIPGFSSDEIHPEFGSRTWEFEPGDVLAYGQESLIEVGLDKLTPLETVFQLEKRSGVPDGETRVDPGADKIAIAASPRTYDAIHALRGTAFGRAVLLNSVYLPAVMVVLSAVRAGEHHGTRWYRVFEAKCNELGFALDSGTAVEAHEDAQRLLQSPLGHLLDFPEMKAI